MKSKKENKTKTIILIIPRWPIFPKKTDFILSRGHLTSVFKTYFYLGEDICAGSEPTEIKKKKKEWLEIEAKV